MNLEQWISDIPDFPKKGIIFKDISPLLKEKFPELIDQMAAQVNWDEVDYIAGIESRGFILGAALSAKVGKGFIPIRKKGKLPPPVISESYSLEYGEDTLEVKPNKNSSKVLLVDDVLATGGTLEASLKLCKKANYQVTQISLIMNLKFLNDFGYPDIKLHSLLNYE